MTEWERNEKEIRKVKYWLKDIEKKEYPEINLVSLKCYLSGVIDGLAGIGLTHVIGNIDRLSRKKPDYRTIGTLGN